MKKLLIILGLISNVSFAQISFDRTRVIFDHSNSNGQSIVIENSNQDLPYLAQTWIEDQNGQKIVTPLAALPILQRLNPLQKRQIKISLVESSSLPSDQESLFYLNILGVPPKDGVADNQVDLVIQSKLKVFYRPKGLKKYQENGWLKELVISKTGSNITINNPTPYHAVIFGFGNKNAKGLTEKDLLIAPFSEETVQIKLGNTPSIYFIDDYGGAMTLDYNCQQASCQLVQ